MEIMQIAGKWCRDLMNPNNRKLIGLHLAKTITNEEKGTPFQRNSKIYEHRPTTNTSSNKTLTLAT
jgi:hypothetical protein